MSSVGPPASVVWPLCFAIATACGQGPASSQEAGGDGETSAPSDGSTSGTGGEATSGSSGSETGQEAAPECSLRMPEGDMRATTVDLGDWPPTQDDSATVFEVDAQCDVLNVVDEGDGTTAHHFDCLDAEGVTRPIVLRTTFSPALPLSLSVGDAVRFIHRDYQEHTNFTTWARSTAIRSAADLPLFLSLDGGRFLFIEPSGYAPVTVELVWGLCPETEIECGATEWMALDVGNDDTTLRLWSGQRESLAAPGGTWTVWAGNLFAKRLSATECGDVTGDDPMALTVVWEA